MEALIPQEIKGQMKELAKKLYETVGARVLDINIRITPDETVNRVSLEFYDYERHNSPVGGCRN